MAKGLMKIVRSILRKKTPEEVQERKSRSWPLKIESCLPVANQLNLPIVNRSGMVTWRLMAITDREGARSLWIGSSVWYRVRQSFKNKVKSFKTSHSTNLLQLPISLPWCYFLFSCLCWTQSAWCPIQRMFLDLKNINLLLPIHRLGIIQPPQSSIGINGFCEFK